MAFLQLLLALLGVFANPPPFCKSISKPRGDFAAISKLEDHFAAKRKKRNIFAAHFEAWRSFRSHFEVWKLFRNHFEVWKSFLSHLEAWRSFLSQKGDFAANGGFRRGYLVAAKSFRSQKAFLQPRRNFAAKCHFRSPCRSCETGVQHCEMTLVCQRVISQLRKFSQRGIGGYETISQWEAIFEARLGGPFSQTGALFRLRNFADHAFSLLLSSS